MARVLLVEDDPFIGEIYIKKFEASGFEVLNVVTGKAVLKAVAENGPFDIVLLDLVIPEMSGMEVLKELRTNPTYPKDVKIVVFSNLSSQEDRDQCVSLGANGFISKTEFSPSEVIEEVNRFLRQWAEQGKNEVRIGVGTEAVAPETVISDEDQMPLAESTAMKRILLVEDQEDFVEMFGKRLRDEGYDVVVAHDGSIGLEKATTEHYDLIISDILMPVMNGHEMVLKLRETEVGKNVPIFLFSASIEVENLQSMIDKGVISRVFEKTRLTPSDLVYAVNDFFAGK